MVSTRGRRHRQRLHVMVRCDAQLRNILRILEPITARIMQDPAVAFLHHHEVLEQEEQT